MRSGKRKIRLDEVRWLVTLSLGWVYWLASSHAPQPVSKKAGQVHCADCGACMRVVAIKSDPLVTLSERALAYLDSG